MESRKGVIFPISESNLMKIKTGRNVFVKFSNLIVKKGYIIQFYISKTLKLVKIEADVVNAEVLDPNSIKAKYINDLILTKEEFNQYISRTKDNEMRTSKRLIVIKFANVRECNFKPTKTVYIAGRYI